MAWAETNPTDHLVPSPLPWQGCQPLDWVARAPPASPRCQELGFGTILFISTEVLSEVQRSNTQTKQLSKPERSLLLLRAQNMRDITSQVCGSTTDRGPSDDLEMCQAKQRAEFAACPQQRKLEQPCGTVHRHRAMTHIHSGTLPAVCYLNGQPFRNTEC